MIPSIGRIVHYYITTQQADQINRRRKDAQDKIDWHRAFKTGAMVHIGNVAHAGDCYPMLIVRVWGTDAQAAVNGQAFLDGSDTLWVTSVTVGATPGSYSWPYSA